MGGDLTVASEPGSGSTFTLWLPVGVAGVLDHDAAAALAEGGARARREPGAPPRVIGLAEVGARLRHRIEEVIAAFAARLRMEPSIPTAARLNRAELEDHQLSFLADVAQTLIVVEDMGGADADLLRDGSTIQRVIAELHGVMRRRRGWTEAQLEREYTILGEELVAAVRRGATAGIGDVSLAVEVVGRLLERARANGLAALRRTAESEAAEDG